MGLIVTTDDFKTIYQIAQNQYDKAELDAFIDRYEQPILEELLGCELSTLFIADLLNGVPQTQRFIDIFNAFCLDEDVTSIWFDVKIYWNQYFINDPFFISNQQVKSFGIKDLLQGLIYFEYVRATQSINTIAGEVNNTFSNSERTPIQDSRIYSHHNAAVKTYRAIQYYICKNLSTYPEFEGVRKNYLSWL